MFGLFEQKRVSSLERRIKALSNDLDRVRFRYSLLVELSQMIDSAKDMPEVINVAQQAVGAVSLAVAVSTALINPKNQLVLWGGSGFQNFAAEKQVFALNYTDSPMWTVYLTGKPYYGTVTDLSVMAVQAAFPLSANNRVLGVLGIHKCKELDHDDILFIETLCRQVGLALQNAINLRMVEQKAKVFEEKATVDAMTQIYNRAYMQDRFPQEISAAKHRKTPLTILAFDVDKFKVFNDTYGHTFGDIVLKDVARLLTKCIRENDVPVRYGGEEFLAILPDTPVEKGAVLAERLRKAVETHQFIDPDRGITARVTISIGVAEWDGVADVKQFIEAADARLYKAKETGRNRVVAVG